MFMGCHHDSARRICDSNNSPVLFIRYLKAGQLKTAGDNHIRLNLTADLHFADCGAPDCYGTELKVDFFLLPAGQGCILESVYVRSQNFFCPGYEVHPSDLTPRDESYIAVKEDMDLCDPALDRLELRSENGSEAIILGPDNFFYFENITKNGVLRERLQNDDDKDDCCWGATSSMLNQH